MNRSSRGVKAPASTVPAIWSGMTRPVGAVFPAAIGGIPIGEGGLEPPFCREKRCKKPTRRTGPLYLLIHAASGEGIDLLFGVAQEEKDCSNVWF